MTSREINGTDNDTTSHKVARDLTGFYPILQIPQKRFMDVVTVPGLIAGVLLWLAYGVVRGDIAIVGPIFSIKKKSG